MYNKLAGMTGTADTEAEEFGKIYNLEVVVVPTNKPIARVDEADVIYKNKKAKYKAIGIIKEKRVMRRKSSARIQRDIFTRLSLE